MAFLFLLLPLFFSISQASSDTEFFDRCWACMDYVMTGGILYNYCPSDSTCYSSDDLSCPVRQAFQSSDCALLLPSTISPACTLMAFYKSQSRHVGVVYNMTVTMPSGTGCSFILNGTGSWGNLTFESPIEAYFKAEAMTNFGSA